MAAMRRHCPALTSGESPRGGFQHFAGPPATPHKQSPGLDAPDDFDDLALAVKEGRVNREAHEERVDAVAPQDQHAPSAFKTASPN